MGERGSGLRPRGGAIQDFAVLRDQCLSQGTLFEDPDFPANNSSLFYSKSPPKPFEWKRPGVSNINFYGILKKIIICTNLIHFTEK